MTTPTTRLKLRVSPGAPRNRVVGRYGGAWKIRVAAAPQRGRANSVLVEYLARRLGIASASIKVVSGLAARDKTVEFSGIDLDEAERRLAIAELDDRP